jgi:hypothetical protein
MNAIGIALTWCIVQITLLGVLAAGLYLLVRRLRPAAAAPVVFSSLAVVVVLSLLALSPWPRWPFDGAASSAHAVALANSPMPTEKAAEASGTEEVVGKTQTISRTSSRQPPPSPSIASPSAKNRRDEKPIEPLKAGPVTQPRPSSAALLWRALMAELSNIQADGTWRWPAVVAVVLFAAMTCGLGWLILGITATRWQQRRSKTVSDAELSELIDVLRAELGCLRAVEVRESSDLATAATLGWRRPVVLVPADWRSWTPEQRRAVLAHEIVHARSQDSVALLFGQLGLMLHCYHPLLHWLMSRLRLEQELAADAAAASVSGGPRQYLSTIAEIALLTQDRRLSWPTRTFLPTRTTFLRRIAMLRGNPVRFDPVSPLGRLTVIGTVLLFGALVAGLRGPGQSSQALAGNTPTAPTGPMATKPLHAPQRAEATAQQARAVQPVAPTPSLSADAKMQYGCKKGEKYYYNVKIAATLPDEDVTHEGVLAYDVLSSTDGQFTLRCNGNLHVAKKPKADAMPGGIGSPFARPPHRFGPPHIPAPPGFFGRGEPIRPQETTFDRQGKIIRRGESPWLPLLLGNQVELVIDQFPGEAKPAWTIERELGVIERSESSGPPFFGPFGRGGSETNRGAKERIDYTVGGQDQDSIRIGKKYSLRTAPEQGVTHIDMSGDGELVFDRRLGMLRSEKMKYDIHVNESNVAVNIPLTLDYRLMTDAEAAGQKRREEEQSAKLKAEIAARAAADKPRPLAPGETESILRDLRSADEHRVQDAARRLSKTMPTRYPLELFSRPLCAAYKNKNEWTQAALMAALRIWATRDAEQTVIEGSRNASFMVRNEAIPALGKFKTAAAAEAAAAQAAHNQREVETAMKAMGPVAEPAAISLLENSDFWVRGVAANVLAEIGGKRALAALAREARAHPHHVHEVETAIVAIENRLAEAGVAADAPAEDRSTPEEGGEKPEPSGPAAMRTWHAAVGSFTVEATFVELKSGKVALKKANGRIVKVPLEKLSPADQDYAKQQAKALEKLEDPFRD